MARARRRPPLCFLKIDSESRLPWLSARECLPCSRIPPSFGKQQRRRLASLDFDTRRFCRGCWNLADQKNGSRSWESRKGIAHRTDRRRKEVTAACGRNPCRIYFRLLQRPVG